MSEKTVCRGSIIQVAQRLYDIHFFQNAGYKLALLESEVQIFVQPQTSKRKGSDHDGGAGNQAGTPADHEPAADGAPTTNYQDLSIVAWIPDNEPPSKYRKPSPENKPTAFSFVAWKADEDVSIQDIQESYRKAREAGRLHSSSLPQLKSAHHSPIERWDPYTLTKVWLSSALLDDEKLCKMRKQLDRTISKVPKAMNWAALIKEYWLTPTNLHEILLIAFGFMELHQKQLPIAGERPYILMVASFLLDRANIFEAQQTTSGRVMAVARIVGYALMRVCEVAERLTPAQVACYMKDFFKGNDGYQKQSRNLACFWCWAMASLPGWKGRELQLYLLLVKESSETALRELFQPSLPGAAGEFVSLLRSEDYAQDTPKSMKVPGVVEIVRALLGNHVSDVVICRALGCPDDYLDGFEDRLPKTFQFLTLQNPSQGMSIWRSTQSQPEPAWTADQGTQELPLVDSHNSAAPDHEDSGVPLESETTAGLDGASAATQIDGNWVQEGDQLEDFDLLAFNNVDLDQYFLPEQTTFDLYKE